MALPMAATQRQAGAFLMQQRYVLAQPGGFDEVSSLVEMVGAKWPASFRNL